MTTTTTTTTTERATGRAAEPWVLALAALDRDDGAIAGGKAANLGALIRVGAPVPAGFCVGTSAYRAAIGGALDDLLRAIDALPASSLADLESLADEARRRIAALPVPPAIVAAVARAYRELGDDAAVAVRSSATAEDLEGAAFAGQQDTYLNVVGEAALVDAIRNCWASLFSDRAVVYRRAHGVAGEGLALAVVVQRLVPAAVAGVLFTADPIGGSRRRAVIEANPGLGEAVVSGAVDPDRLVVASDGSIALREVGRKQRRIDAVEGGGTVEVELAGAGADGGALCIDDDAARRLAAEGRRIAAAFGAPQDIEWAIDRGGALWILQSRPITTLYPLPEGAPAGDDDLRVYFNFNVAQGVPQPMTPLGRDLWRHMMGGVASRLGMTIDPEVGAPFVIDGGERLLFDVTPLIRSEVGRRFASQVLRRMEARSDGLLPALLAEPRLSPRPTRRLRLLRRVGRIARRTGAPVSFLRTLRSPAAAQAACGRRCAEAAAARAVTMSDDPRANLAAIRAILAGTGFPLVTGIMPHVFGGFAALNLARRLLRGRAAAAEIEGTLRALPGNPTMAMDVELFALARALSGDPASARAIHREAAGALAAAYSAGTLPPAFQAGLGEFLARHGERGVAEVDVGVPRWREEPTQLFSILAGYLAAVEAGGAADLEHATRAAEAEAAIDAVAATAGLGRRWLVRGLLRRARAVIGLREVPKLELVRSIAVVRALARRIGGALVEAGRIDAVDDVFFLRLAEIAAAIDGADLRAEIAARAAARAHEMRRRHVPRFILSDGSEPGAGGGAAAVDAPDGALRGAAASTGVIRGVAHVVLDPREARLAPGEILVAPATDPGWTPLFLAASGLVMEMGGAMSHGAVVAREYGIPAVVGVADATSKIRSGQVIEVDGGNGIVRVIEGDAGD
ncbi:MAG: phosphoenolpyruvate synthase [Myxococcales bacterium]|nr:phosphoenolpyruvate synthase [Myxococcales bacterium]